MRQKMGEVAVRVAKAANYANAGTIEFLADNAGNFYFLVMNTRLQVEHPVTELVTGLDLVQLQIRIAAGEKLPFAQAQVSLRGHAIECRVYAEDPANDYFPSPGEITVLSEPAGPGIRVDSGIYAGWNVPLEYDPLLAKLVGFGESRAQAIGRLKRALDEYTVGGVKTNLELFRQILSDPEFLAGNTDTGFIGRLRAADPIREYREIAVIAAGILYALDSNREQERDERPSASASNWEKVARSEGLR
jgi:acetyl-CoA carboxylase biotin carboxylase subunit